MKLYFVRHGETDVNRILGHGVSGPMHDEPVSFAPGGDTNISLNVYGRAHAHEACSELPEKIDGLYSSPLLRAKETAEIIAGMKNINPSNVQFHDALIEYYKGSLEGVSNEQKKEILGDQTYGSGLLCNYDYTPWGGDHWKTIYDRLSFFIEDLRNSGIEKNIVCVSSGGVIRMAYKILLSEKSPGITKHILVKNGSVHEFVV